MNLVLVEPTENSVELEPTETGVEIEPVENHVIVELVDVSSDYFWLSPAQVLAEHRTVQEG